jgi:hypothetical protein
MDAITLDILIDPNGEARRVLEELKADFMLAGSSAEDAAKKVEKFEQGIKDQAAKRQASERLKELSGAHAEAGRAAQSHAEINGKLAASVMQYAAPAVIVSATKKTLEYADSLQELSQKTGFSIEGLQRIGAVAKASGSSFEQVAGAMNQLQNRLESGNKQAAAALRALGIAHDDYMRRSPDEQFREVAEAIAGIEDPAKRTQAAMALLGRSGADLIPTFMAIKEGGLESASVLSTEFVEAAAEANDELDKLMTKGQQMMQVFLAWPLLWVKTLQDWRAALVDFGKGMPSNLPNVGSPTNPFVPQTGAAADPFAPGAFGGNSLSFVEKELTDAVKDNIRARKKNTATVDALTLTEEMQGVTTQALTRRGMFGAGWGQNIPGVGPGSFPGWALPFQNLPNTMNLGFSGANVNGTGAWMLRAPVESALSGGGASGGNWLSRMFGGRTGQIAGGLLGMLPGLIPGLSGRGSSIGGSAGSMIGALVGGPLAPVLGPLGGFLGGAIGKLFGKSEHSKVNDLRDEYTARFGNINNLAEQVRQAGGTMDAFFKAKTVKDFERAVADLEQKLGDLAAKKDEIADLRGEIEQLTDAARVDFDDMARVAQEFGLDIKKLGPAFQQQAIDKEAQRIIDAFAIMEKGGADMGGVLDGMQEEISGLVSQSLQFGTTVPENMRPWIEELSRSGRLVDENGKKIEDLTGIKFGAPLESETDKMIRALDELTTKLGELTSTLRNELPEAARRAVDGANDAFRDFRPPEVDIRVPGEGDPNNAVPIARGGVVLGPGRVQYFNRGGWVDDYWRPIGTDTVPAMLTPGEMVIPKDAARELAPYMPRIIEGGIEELIGRVPLVDHKIGMAPAPPTMEVRAPYTPSPGDLPIQPVPMPTPRNEIGVKDTLRTMQGDVTVVFVDGRASDREVINEVFKQMGRRVAGNDSNVRTALQAALNQRRRVA